MNKRNAIFLVSILIIGVALLYFLRPSQKIQDKPSSNEKQPPLVETTKMVSAALVKPQPSSRVVTQSVSSNDAAVMEYLQKTKADLQYDGKQPINFYGRVLDESNNPVSGASISFSWRNLSPNEHDVSVASDGNGFFSLISQTGNRLEVTVGKEGYYSSGNARYSAYEYANPALGLFAPDPNNPVIFRLRKKGVGADLIHGVKLLGSRIDGTISYVDLTDGKNKLTPPGDLTVQFIRSPKNADRKFDWSFTLGAVDGGLIESTNEFMFLAPEEGYQSTFQISHAATDPNWIEQEKHKFYVKSQDGKHYARIEINIIPDYGKNAAYDLKWDLNPNGSRNLEPKSSN
jgi:hypothetical protein